MVGHGGPTPITSVRANRRADDLKNPVYPSEKPRLSSVNPYLRSLFLGIPSSRIACGKILRGDVVEELLELLHDVL